jgi:hypothetical protein
MSLDLAFETQGDRFQVRLPKSDWDLLFLLHETCPKEVELVTGADDFGFARQENREALLQAVDALLTTLKMELGKLPYIYGYRFVGGIMDGDAGSGGTFGIQIGGDGYSYGIEAGLGECVLIKQGRRPDGWGFDLERRDVREVTSIKTDNMGEIRIYRKKKKNGLKRFLEQLKDFLSRNADETVITILG